MNEKNMHESFARDDNTRPLLLDLPAPRSASNEARAAALYRHAQIEESNRSHMILSHRYLVDSVASQVKQTLPAHVQREELEAAGYVGLIDAVDRYVQLDGVPFHTYAQVRIRGAILDSLRSTVWTPRSLRKKKRLIASAMTAVAHKFGRPGDDSEVAAEAGMDLQEYQVLMGELECMDIGSLNVVCNSAGDDLLSYIPAPSDGTPLYQCLQKEFEHYLSRAIENLPERERTIVTLCFVEELTSREIASVLSISVSRVSQLRTKAILQIRGDLAKVVNPEAGSRF